MASQPRQFSIEKQTYRGAVPEGLAAVPMPTGEAGQAAATGFGALAEKFSKWADQAAKAEGERDAKINAAENRFDRTGASTIYGQSYDAAALDAQLASVTATFRDRTLTLFDENRNNPEALRAALQREVADHEAALPAEARAGFRAKASDIGVVLQRQAINNRISQQQDEARANFIRRSDETTNNNRRALAIAPFDPAVEQSVRQANEGLITSLEGAAAGGLMDQAVVAREVAKIRQQTEADILQAQAATLRTPEEVDAYRQMLRDRAQRGALPTTVDVAAVDAELQKLANQKRVEGDRQARALQSTLDDAVTRSARGQELTAAESAALETDAAKLGPRGAAMLENARTNMSIARRMSTMSLPQQQQFVDSLRQDVASRQPGSRTTPQEQSTADYYRRRGFTPVQAAAIASYLLAESTFDPNAINPGDGRDGSNSIGMGQWNAERAQALIRFAAARGKPVGDRETQLEFVLHELQTTESAAGRRLMAAATPEEATAAMVAYGRPAGWRSGAGGHLGVPSWQARLGNTQRIMGGVSRSGAELVQFAEAQLTANRSAINSDMIGYAATRLPGAGEATPLNFNSSPDDLARQMRARVVQAEAVAETLGPVSPQYLRPDEKPAFQAIVQQGGERALRAVEAIVGGAGASSPRVLKEIGGDAPALAQAAAVTLVTGDRTFALGVANALNYRHVSGAPRDSANRADFEEVGRTTLGSAMNAMPPEERARTAAAVQLWWENEVRLRGYDPKGTQARELLTQGFQRARGGTTVNDVEYGGVGPYRPAANWFQSENVQVPPTVRRDSFGDVLKAITDQDLAALPSRPMKRNGEPMTAAELRQMMPEYVGSGYAFRLPTLHENRAVPVLDQNRRSYVLNLDALLPTLRQRVPGAFR